MDVDKPSHPCELEPHIQTVMKDRGLSVKIRTFLVRSLPENYPYRLSKAGMVAGGATQIPFLEIHGMGLPTEYPDFGIAGDVYLDLKHPGAYACYSKSSSQWVQWDPVASCGARDILVSDLTPHPHFTAERFLWCDETSVGWHRHEIIKTMQRQMHRHGLYERGENVDNNTHSSNVAAKILKVVITATNNKQTQKGEIQEGDSEVVAAEKKIRDIRTRKIPPALATDPTEPSISSSFSRAGTSETSNSTPSIYPVIHSGPHTTAQNEISYGSTRYHKTASDSLLISTAAHRVQEQVRNLIAENKMLKNASSNRLFTDAGTSTEVFDSSGSGSASLSPRVLSIFAESISSKQVLESLGNG